MIVYMCVSMEKKAAGQSFGNDGGGSERLGHDMSKERNKRKPQLYMTVAKMGNAKCIEMHDLGEWEECKAMQKGVLSQIR